MKIKWLFLAMIGLWITLPAWGENRISWSAQEYLAHPEVLQTDVTACGKALSSGTDLSASLNCSTVSQAANEIQKQLLLASQNGDIFGEKILRLEMTIADLQAQLTSLNSVNNQTDNPHSNPKEALQQQIQQNQLLLQEYLGIIRLLGI